MTLRTVGATLTAFCLLFYSSAGIFRPAARLCAARDCRVRVKWLLTSLQMAGFGPVTKPNTD